MREFVFRGKPKNEADYELIKSMYSDNCKNGFIYGSLIVGHGKYYICVTALCQVNSLVNNGRTTMFEVIPETVGEYTTLTDKNDRMIFEGDIVKHTQNYDISGIVISIGAVKYSDSYGGWSVGDFSNDRIDRFLANESHRVEIVGNVYDNPDLLEVKE